MQHRSLLVLAALCAGIATSADAQKVPKRPKLAAGADTNDARVLTDYGNFVLRRDPAAAADAFYWATKIDPTLAEAYYGRHVALHIQQPRRLSSYWSGNRSVVQNKDVQRIDSLFSYALMLNPVFVQRHERAMVIAVIKGNVEASGGPTLSPADELRLEQDLDYYIKDWAAGSRARMAYAEGNYSEALQLYGKAIKETRKPADYRAARGRLFLQLGKADSALAEFNLALDELRKRDKKDFVYIYNSKALLELTQGLAHEQAGDTAGARKAYGRALEEDLSYFPAHVRLGFLSATTGDTSTAISEFGLAVQLRPDDGLLRHQYGSVLKGAGKHPEAIEQFDKAIELEPFFAMPHRLRGESLEKLGKTDDAKAAYRRYLELASQKATGRDEIQAKLAGQEN